MLIILFLKLHTLRRYLCHRQIINHEMCALDSYQTILNTNVKRKRIFVIYVFIKTL